MPPASGTTPDRRVRPGTGTHALPHIWSLSHTGLPIGGLLTWAALLVTLGSATLFLARRPSTR